MDPRRHLTELVISANAEDAPPTPPYRQYPPSVTSDIQSPPYKSRSQVQLMEENEKQASNEELAKSKPSVHYPDSVPQKPSGFVPTHSRMPSVPPSDDDNDEDEYDWSTEEYVPLPTRDAATSASFTREYCISLGRPSELKVTTSQRKGIWLKLRPGVKGDDGVPNSHSVLQLI